MCIPIDPATHSPIHQLNQPKPSPSQASFSRSDHASRAVSVAQMQRIDATAIETLGIPRLLLMDHAGLAVARAVQTLVPSRSSSILVCCGIGFNGGDGLSAARHLHGWGYPVRLVLTSPPDQLRDEPAVYAQIVQRMGLSFYALTVPTASAQLERWLTDCSAIVDALLGIGLRGDVREPMASCIALMNRSGKPIVAVDIPSGLDGDTGQIHGVAVHATVTVTFGLPKLGCLRGEGPASAGSLVVESITIPQTLLEVAG